MKEIVLFHSYNYTNCKYKLINNTIYDYNNNFLFKILNVPKNNMYNLKIDKKLITKKISLCNNNNFYTTNNLKIFIKINYNLLLKYLIQNDDIPDKVIIFKLLKLNFLKHINKDTKFNKSICINSKFKKDISNMLCNFNFKLNFNNVQLYNLFFDLNNNTINNTNTTHIYNKININGGLLLYDICKFMINDIIHLLKNKKKKINTSLFITKNKLLWIEKLKDFKNITITDNYDDYNKNIIYDLVIIDNYFLKNKIKYKNIILLSKNINYITIEQLLNILDIYFKFNFNKYIITYDILYKLLKNVIYIRNYKKNLNYNINYLNINNKLYNFDKITNKDIINFSSKCSICYNEIKNNICKTKCNHYFCLNCIEKLFTKNITNISCPICRTKLTNKNIFKININDNIEEIVNNNILNLIKNNKNIVVISNNTIANYIKKIIKYKNYSKNIIYYDNKKNNDSLKLNYNNKYAIIIINKPELNIDNFLNNNLVGFN